VFSDQFRSTALDLAVDGNDLWVATSYGLALYDRSIDPPAFVASIAIPGTTRVVRLANGNAYAGSGSSVAVVRKSGRTLQLVQTVDTGVVNDMVANGTDLYVATSTGLLDLPIFALGSPGPQRVLPTSSPTVYSLTLINSSLYVADGDASVEVINISIPSLPQSSGALTSSIARPTSVRGASGKLFVSDGRQSELWTGVGSSMTKVASYSFGASSVAPLTTDVVFLAGTDRTIRAFDLSLALTPVGTFVASIPVIGGSVNRVGALAFAANRLYAAAGDSGLLTYDATSFPAPFPLHAYSTGASTSIANTPDHVYVGNTAGGIMEFGESANGTLTKQRSWDGSRTDVVLDGGDGWLISSSGATMNLWSTKTSGAISTPISTATFRASVTDAVLVGLTAYAVLADRTLWSADLSLASPTPAQIAVNASPTSIARSGGAIAVADPRDDGTTTVVYFADPKGAPASINVPGVTTTAVALNGSTAAVFTFRGITLIDFATKTTTAVPQSSGSLARALAVSASSILDLTSSTLDVYDRTAQRMTAQFVLPSTPSQLNYNPDLNVAAIATADGITSIALGVQNKLPSLLAVPNPNAFFKKVIATPNRVLLSDQNGTVEIYTTALHHTGTIHAPGMVDVAANASGTYILFGNRTIGGYSIDGVPLRQTSINDTSDSQALSINTAGNAVWVSYSRGCLTATCEKRTNVYDASLNQTVTFSGAVVDIDVLGNRAYAIVDLPAEVRTYDISNPLLPAQIASHAAEGVLPETGITVSGTTLYVLGEKMYTYDAATLTKTGEQFSSFTPDPVNGLSAVDQHIRADGTCGVMTGRSFGAMLLSFNSTIESPPFGSPSAARFVARQPGVFYILTDHSLEIWSTSPMPSLPRRHAAK